MRLLLLSFALPAGGAMQAPPGLRIFFIDVEGGQATLLVAPSGRSITIPRGWSREFPHLMSMEAVFGAEQYKFRQAFTTRAAWLNTVLPFTRNVIGPMDYTPVTFTDVRHPRTTTNAHELAQSVVFESGIQHFADSVESYRALPDAAKQFLKQVPAAWDETRGIAGEPGKFVVIARREGETWYVGGLNADTAAMVKVPLAFLGAGSWSMTLIGDGAADREFKDSTRSVTSTETIEVPMRARGGFVMRLAKRSDGRQELGFTTEAQRPQNSFFRRILSPANGTPWISVPLW